MNDLLGHLWHGAPVIDQVSLKITFFALPYHFHSYQVTELFAYFMDLCETDASNCLFNQYKDFVFENVDTNLTLTNLGKNEFITYWTTQVANEFGLDQQSLAGIYTSSTYSVDGDTRDFFKYAASNGISGTPTAYINGVKLDNVPRTVNTWIMTLE